MQNQAAVAPGLGDFTIDAGGPALAGCGCGWAAAQRGNNQLKALMASMG